MRVALFATCLVDTFRPSVGFASIKLLEAAGCTVEVPLTQTCCGQPAYNSGDVDNARALAKQVMETFSGYEYVVIPSGSCGGMLIKHYPQLFEHDTQWQQRAEDFAGRCHELVTFLHDVLHLREFAIGHDGEVTYHDSCSSLREIRSSEKARRLIQGVQGTTLKELANSEVCCGFGGTFAVKYTDISQRMVDEKITSIDNSGAPLLLSSDLGCLLNIAGRGKRLEKKFRAYHVAEFLADMLDQPAIGEGKA